MKTEPEPDLPWCRSGIVCIILVGMISLTLTDNASACGTGRSYQGYSITRLVESEEKAGKHPDDETGAKNKKAGGQAATGTTSEQHKTERKNKDSLKLIDRKSLPKTRC
ncbi:hypothetical protein [Thalassospira xiamenensis]|uniref:Uncharacterized protein n=1 Tax=Thalassospira xiamenensis TaxID=220697 RepID=A0A285TY86_9PROT|nr:hypothetical protein [Thalassospira xiamenensis]SOC31373.1 hypothetical protein SAMN05428964_1169 [Thalassospira xiamenensis]